MGKRVIRNALNFVGEGTRRTDPVKETPNKSANSRQLSVNKDEEAETR